MCESLEYSCKKKISKYLKKVFERGGKEKKPH